MSEQRRESFRLEFPRSCCPRILIKGTRFDIFDASENGVKFYYDETADLEINETTPIQITFRDQDSFNMDAMVVRIDPLYVCLQLMSPIPLKKIRSEHLYLIQKYSEKKPIFS